MQVHNAANKRVIPTAFQNKAGSFIAELNKLK